MIEQKRNPVILRVPLLGTDSESMFDRQRRTHHHRDLREHRRRIRVRRTSRPIRASRNRHLSQSLRHGHVRAHGVRATHAKNGCANQSHGRHLTDHDGRAINTLRLDWPAMLVRATKI